jgi:hypothetical protein
MSGRHPWFLVIALTALTSAASAEDTTVRHENVSPGVDRWIVEPHPSGKPRFFQLYERIAKVELPAPPDLPFGRSVALLVGVSEYSELPPLPFVKQDLVNLRTFLLGPGGFDEVYTVADGAATPELVETFMMERLPAELKPEDRVLFYYSGHGTDAGGETGYMAFGSAKPKRFTPSTVLAVTRTREWARVLEPRHVLFVLDSCSAGLGYGEKAGPEDDVAQRIRTLAKSGSRLVLTAGTADEVTVGFEGPKGGSAFTRALIAALAGRPVAGPYGSLLTSKEVFADAAKMAMEAAAAVQKSLTPRDWSLQTDVHRGSFLFLNPMAEGQPLAPDIVSKLQARVLGPQAADPGAPIGSWHDLRLRLDAQTRQGPGYLLDLGPVSEPREVVLQLVNASGALRRLQLRVEGDGVEASFPGGGQAAALLPNGETELRLRVDARSVGPVGRVMLLGATDGPAVAPIDIRAGRAEATLTTSVSSGPQLSGSASSFSPPYKVCSGPSPAGYTFASDSFALTGDRQCGSWATCTPMQRDDNDVCWSFTLQGHNEFPAILNNAGRRSSEGHLRVEYKLRPQPPRLEVAP